MRSLPQPPLTMRSSPAPPCSQHCWVIPPAMVIVSLPAPPSTTIVETDIEANEVPTGETTRLVPDKLTAKLFAVVSPKSVKTPLSRFAVTAGVRRDSRDRTCRRARWTTGPGIGSPEADQNPYNLPAVTVRR